MLILMRALASKAKERLPICHESGSKPIYEAQLSTSDWTIDSDLNLDNKKKSDGHKKITGICESERTTHWSISNVRLVKK